MTHDQRSVPAGRRNPNWRDEGSCAGHGNDRWFPQPGNQTGVLDAKAVCFGCPVMLTCAQYALTTHQEGGVWGGLSEGQRNTLHKKHRTAGFDNPATVRTAVLSALRDELNPERSLRDIWEQRTYPLPGGHIGWRGESSSFTFRGHVYTPKQLAFLLDRGHKATGIVRRTPECPVVECVNPLHLGDNAERFQRRQAAERAAALAAARVQYAADELAS